MSQHENRVADLGNWRKTSTPIEAPEISGLSVAGVRSVEEAGHSIGRQLNGPLTALLLYMEELKQHSDRFLQPRDRDHLLGARNTADLVRAALLHPIE